jgi:hypothetical protein
MTMSMSGALRALAISRLVAVAYTPALKDKSLLARRGDVPVDDFAKRGFVFAQLASITRQVTV